MWVFFFPAQTPPLLALTIAPGLSPRGQAGVPHQHLLPGVSEARPPLSAHSIAIPSAAAVFPRSTAARYIARCIEALALIWYPRAIRLFLA